MEGRKKALLLKKRSKQSMLSLSALKKEARLAALKLLST
jgi:hypothetical protein